MLCFDLVVCLFSFIRTAKGEVKWVVMIAGKQ